MCSFGENKSFIPEILQTVSSGKQMSFKIYQTADITKGTLFIERKTFQRLHNAYCAPEVATLEPGQ